MVKKVVKKYALDFTILALSGLTSGLIVAGINYYSQKKLQQNQMSLNRALDMEKGNLKPHNGNGRSHYQGSEYASAY